MGNGTILIVDDERDIVDVVKAYLEREGFTTIEAYDGESALDLWREQRPDLVVLDILMPRLDGLSFCRTVREESQVPIIFISARTEEDNRLEGLELGADDYMIKPFSPRELVARVRAVLRRHAARQEEAQTVKAGPMSIDAERYRVEVAGEEVVLTPMEFKMLTALASRPGQVLSRDELIGLTQGDEYEGYDRNIDNHVKNIRRKLKRQAADWSFIETVYGVGYRFEAKQEA
jgi:DNA-binding response OmpR family regulator